MALQTCESGSRAWDFESQDIGYDVRFSYLRETKDYLKASDLRYFVEKPISDNLPEAMIRFVLWN